MIWSVVPTPPVSFIRVEVLVTTSQLPFKDLKAAGTVNEEKFNFIPLLSETVQLPCIV